jgi:hypothetical protein
MFHKENKNTMRPRLIAFSFVALLGSLFILSCDEDDDDPKSGTSTFRATMNGSSEVPANGSTATGTATLTFNSQTKILSGTVTYTGLTVTAAHIHKGAVGVSGNVIFPFAGSLASPISFTSVALTSEQEADLNAGLYYVNLHTVAYPDGEIRGQLTKE